MITRYLEQKITEDLTEKMVLVAGPRQVGKTTLVKQVLSTTGPGVYLSWDNRSDRKEILNVEWPSEGIVVLDELHKYRFWKGWLKGEYDKNKEHLRFLVTGSSRLDVYRRGGDSLQGRYHHYRLHPLTIAEIEGGTVGKIIPGKQLPIPTKEPTEILAGLMKFGGFPEPFLAQSERSLRRWQKERLDRFFREDVRDLESIRDLSLIEILAESLLERVASPLSINALREDLEVSHKAVSHWIEILERLYHIFIIRPFESRAIRSLKKMPKAYLWDISPIPDEGARFENVVALHLLKLCHYLEDAEGYRMELWYLRDVNGREVDFLVTYDRKPWFAVEAKLSEEPISKSLRYFQGHLNVPYLYQVHYRGTSDFQKESIRCLPAAKFLAAMV